MPEYLTLRRRDLIAHVALLLGASVLPADVFAAPRGRAPRFLAPRQFALLSAVADTILPVTDTPGALAAQVPARLDGMLANWASPATREQILASLVKIDTTATAHKNKAFVALSAADRAAVLGAYDAEALKVVPPPGAPTMNLSGPIRYFADQGYFKIKDLTINLYYYSEVGSGSELLYEHVPGKFEPSLKLTAQSRPFLGIGPL
ncbi:MAG: gluconate 2-dehydrogenase subunit 3 family protein [Novosphingobium sp.]|nr:gluconate 2-dehydrogenase subunit 3 family protein [Novosphingobium sp.]